MITVDATLRIYLQYYEKEINLTRLVEKAYQEGSTRFEKPLKAIEVYVKPEDGKAYYVVNSELESYVNLWDSANDICDSQELSGELNWHSEVQRRLIFEYRGRQCDCDSIIDRVLDKFMYIHAAKPLHEIEIYVRQEHETAYYVINGRYTGSVSMFA